MAGRLDGKVCVITGTGGAIGRASALAFAREGATVIGCDLQETAANESATEVRALGFEMHSMQPCDLTSASDCHRLVEFALSKAGRIDVLFNNASRPFYGALTEKDDSHWFNTVDHELHNVYLMCKAAWPALTESSGTIINMASVAGWIALPALAGLAHSTAKSGILGMTRHLAIEGRTSNIRANSISPGVIATPAVRARALDEQWNAAMVSKILRGQFGKPEEIAAVALFLASDESAFVNGADIRADGGMSAW